MIPNVLYPSLLKVCLQQIIRKYNFPHYQKGVISIKSGVTKSASFMWQILRPLLSDPFSTQFRYSALTPQNWLCRKNFSGEYRRSLAICLGLSVNFYHKIMNCWTYFTYKNVFWYNCWIVWKDFCIYKLIEKLEGGIILTFGLPKRFWRYFFIPWKKYFNSFFSDP